MNVNIENLPNCQALMRVEVPAAKVTEERKSLTQAYARSARIPGFRKGKVPPGLIEKRFEKDIAEELESRLINAGFDAGVKKNELQVLSILGVSEKDFHSDDSFTFTAQLLLAPKFELPEYKGVTVQVPRLEVTDEQVEQSLESLRPRFAEFDDIEGRPLAMEDFAIIDYQGQRDGAPLSELLPEAGGHLAAGSDFWLRVAPESFLPGFCDGIIGLSAGEKREHTVTLPDDFPMEELQGTEIVYEVELKGIKEQKLPELDDAFAEKLDPGKTIAEVRDLVRQQLTNEQEQQLQELKSNQIIKWLDEKLDFDIPQQLIESETQRQINDIVQRSRQSGIEEDQLRTHESEIVNNASGQAKLNVKTSFILDEIADAEGIDASEQEVLQQISQMAAQYQTPPKKMIKQLEESNGIGRIRNSIRVSKTLEFLRANANIEEVDPPEAEDAEIEGEVATESASVANAEAAAEAVDAESDPDSDADADAKTESPS